MCVVCAISTYISINILDETFGNLCSIFCFFEPLLSKKFFGFLKLLQPRRTVGLTLDDGLHISNKVFTKKLKTVSTLNGSGSLKKKKYLTCSWSKAYQIHQIMPFWPNKTALLRDSVTRFFASGFFSWITFPQAPEIALGSFRIFSENSRRYLQVKMHHRFQHQRW